MIPEIETYRASLPEPLEKLQHAAEGLNLAALKQELEEKREELNVPDVWNDVERASKINRRIRQIEQRLESYEHLMKLHDDINDLMELCEMEDDRSILPDIQNDVQEFKDGAEELYMDSLLRGDHDDCDCILSLHAGAGGTEAQDWVSMLYRMYQHYCDKRGYKWKELDFLEGDEAGVKSVTFEVDGDMAYGFLKAERGVHRLVRISPFDSSARRHTSFASLDVMPVLDEDDSIVIRPEDIRIDTFRSGGAGGQHVNRTDSAVRIVHLATNIVVQCQNERSQVQNKEMAMRMLRAKLAELHEREKLDNMKQITGELKKIEWGSQIRSYVFQPYTLVKDHRTGYEIGNIDAVMDGDLQGFITSYLQMGGQ